MRPTARTSASVLAQFVGAVLRMLPNRRYLVDTRLAIAARAAARTGRN